MWLFIGSSKENQTTCFNSFTWVLKTSKGQPKIGVLCVGVSSHTRTVNKFLDHGERPKCPFVTVSLQVKSLSQPSDNLSEVKEKAKLKTVLGIKNR